MIDQPFSQAALRQPATSHSLSYYSKLYSPNMAVIQRQQ